MGRRIVRGVIRTTMRALLYSGAERDDCGFAFKPAAGGMILDLCVAPGGKSTQAAARLGGEGLLVSNEIHPARAKILSQNIERMGIRNAVGDK